MAALRLLARREHSAVELARKLAQRGFEPTAIAASLERLRGGGELSDVRFAHALARHRAGQGYGELRIRAELAQHGLRDDIADGALFELDVDWGRLALAQARRHFPAVPRDPAGTARVLRHLAQRGFPAPIARSALAEWMQSVQ